MRFLNNRFRNRSRSPSLANQRIYQILAYCHEISKINFTGVPSSSSPVFPRFPALSLAIFCAYAPLSERLEHTIVPWTLVYIQKLKGFSTTENVRTSDGIECALRRKTSQISNAPIRTWELSTSALNLSIKYSHFSLPSPSDGGRHATKSSIWKTTSKHLTFVNILTKFALS